MDFTKIENIIFVAVSGALALFLFIMAFYVISKGQRKTSGLDIALRIISALVLIVCAGLFALALFTGFTGSFRIVAAGDKAVFVVGDSLTELPIGALFVTLSTSTGQTIVIALFVIAFMTLVADCLLAKKKYGKKTKTEKVKKTPEELKREAELERIRKLSDAAVKKSNSAADKASDKKGTEEKKSEEPIKEEQKAEEEEPSFDWRVGAPEKKEFVGLSSTTNADDDFDTFDDVDGEDNTEEKAQADDFFTEEVEEQEQDYDDGFVDGTPEKEQDLDDDFAADEAEEQEQTEEQEQAEEEKPWYEQDNPADERIIAEALADEPIASPYESRHEEPVEEQAEEDETPWYEQGGETLEEREQSFAESDDLDAAESQEEAEQDDLSDIEPNRSIYIPGIRTVSRSPRSARRPAEAPRQESAPEPEVSREPDKKPAAKKPAAKRTAPQQKKAAPQKSSAAPKKAPAKNKPAAKKPEDKAIDPKKLPITRRYVILDRTNAVNIFNNYLKERDKSGKDKLESSINTIIIK